MSFLSDEARPALRWVGIALMVASGAVAGYVARLAQEPAPSKVSVPVLPACVCERNSQ